MILGIEKISFTLPIPEGDPTFIDEPQTGLPDSSTITTSKPRNPNFSQRGFIDLSCLGPVRTDQTGGQNTGDYVALDSVFWRKAFGSHVYKQRSKNFNRKRPKTEAPGSLGGSRARGSDGFGIDD